MSKTSTAPPAHEIAAARIVAFAETLVAEGALVSTDVFGLSPFAAVGNLLCRAFMQSIKKRWKELEDGNAELRTELAVARVLMKDDGYNELDEPICGPLGLEPTVCMIDGKKAVELMWLMNAAVPLSALYLSKVRSVIDASERANVKL